MRRGRLAVLPPASGAHEHGVQAYKSYMYAGDGVLAACIETWISLHLVCCLSPRHNLAHEELELVEVKFSITKLKQETSVNKLCGDPSANQGEWRSTTELRGY